MSITIHQFVAVVVKDELAAERAAMTCTKEELLAMGRIIATASRIIEETFIHKEGVGHA